MGDSEPSVSASADLSPDSPPSPSADRRPRRHWPALLRALLMVLLVVAGYQLALWVNGHARAKLQTEQALRQQADRELALLKSRLAIVERGTDVTAAANRRVRDELAQMEQALDASRADLDFYRRLLSAGLEKGLGVHELRLRSTASPQVFRFELTLALNSRQPGAVRGQVKLELHGITADQPRRLALTDMLPVDDSRSALDYEFRYFQQLAGDLVLPDDFEPTRLLVTVVPRGKGDPIQREFDWTELQLREEKS